MILNCCKKNICLHSIQVMKMPSDALGRPLFMFAGANICLRSEVTLNLPADLTCFRCRCDRGSPLSQQPLVEINETWVTHNEYCLWKRAYRLWFWNVPICYCFGSKVECSAESPRLFTQHATSRFHSSSAHALTHGRLAAVLSVIRAQQANSSRYCIVAAPCCGCKIPKPRPVLASSHTCQKPSELPEGESVSVAAYFHCLLCTSTPLGWSTPICFTFLSLLFMEHKYYMTISKIKGANFGLEAWNSTECK